MPLMYARNWERPVFPEWSSEFVDKVLTDSPWSQEYTAKFKYSAPAPLIEPSAFAQIEFPGGLPGGLPRTTGRTPSSTRLPFPTGGGNGPRVDDGSNHPVQTEAYLVIRWASALPVRQANALAQFGRHGLEHPKAAEILRGSENDYIIEVAGLPTGMVPQGARRLEARLQENATIQVKGRKHHVADSVSVPEHGTHLMATIRFKRYEDLQDTEGFIEFFAQAGPMQITQKFRLRDMYFRGNLEL